MPNLRSCRRKWWLLPGLVPVAFGLALSPGCGDGGDAAKPAGDAKAQQKKAQEYNKNYRDQLIAESKARAKLKGAASKATSAPDKAAEAPSEK